MSADEGDLHYDSVVAIVRRLNSIGFPAVIDWDVVLSADGFSFGHDQPLTFQQLDALASEFSTKRINFVADAGGHSDTQGYHPDSLVEVMGLKVY